MPDFKPKVSIVIPAYNHEQFVDDSIQSIINQSYTNWELIIINDGSNDNTAEIVDKYRDYHKVFVYHQSNQGLSATLNRGVELATGQLFCFLPSDDYYHKDKLQKQVSEIHNKPELSLIFCDQVVVDGSGRKIVDEVITEWTNVPYRHEWEILPNLFVHNFIPAPSAMIRIHDLKNVGGFNENLTYTQDYDLWLKILPGRKAFWLHEKLLYYRWHGSNLTYKSEEPIHFERACLLTNALSRLQLEDIFYEIGPNAKDSKSNQKAEYALSLSKLLLKSGLLEMLPWSKLYLDKAKQYNSDIVVPKELTSQLMQRKSFMDLRDQRLMDLSMSMGALQSELAIYKQVCVKLKKKEETIQEKDAILSEKEQDLKNKNALLSSLEKELEKARLSNKHDEIKSREVSLDNKDAWLNKRAESLDEKEDWITSLEKDLNEKTEYLNEKEIHLNEKEIHLDSLKYELNNYQNQINVFMSSTFFRTGKFFQKILRAPIKTLWCLGSYMWKFMPLNVKAKFGPRLKKTMSKIMGYSHEAGIEMDNIAETLTSNKVKSNEKIKHVSSPKHECQIYHILDRLPLVSVILPIYNQSNTARLSIESVLNQTYPNFELIIINDGSKDGLEKTLAQYINHPKIKIFEQHNQKLPKALSNGFYQAAGDFLTWTSADNIMLPYQLETLIDFLIKNQNIYMTYSNVEIIDEDGYPLMNSNYRFFNQKEPGSNVLMLPHETETLGSVPDNFINASFMYRRSMHEALGPYDPTLLGTEDYDYWLRANTLLNIRHVDSEEPLYQYRVHKNTLSEQFGTSHIHNNVKKLIYLHKEREYFYNQKFTVILFGMIDNDSKKTSSYILESFLRSSSDNIIVASKKRQSYFGCNIIEAHQVSNYIQYNVHDKKMIMIFYGVETWNNFKKDIGMPDTWKCILNDDLYIQSNENTPPFHEQEIDFHVNVKDIIQPDPALKKAREDKYSLWHFPRQAGPLVVYWGNLSGVNFSQVNSIASALNNWDFAFIPNTDISDKKKTFKASIKTRNVYLLDTHEAETVYHILSATNVVWFPMQEDMYEYQDLLNIYSSSLCAGKPLLVPDRIMMSGKAPYQFAYSSESEAVEKLKALTVMKVDHNIADSFLNCKSPDHLVDYIKAKANNDLYIKKTVGLETFEPEPPKPMEISNKRTVIAFEVQSLDKGGLEQMALNLCSRFDYLRFKPMLVSSEKGGFLSQKAVDAGLEIHVIDGDQRNYLNLCRRENVALINTFYSDIGLNIAKDRNIPLVSTVQNAYVWFSKKERAKFQIQDKQVASYIAVSKSVARYMIERLKIDKKKIFIVPNCIDTDKLEIESKKHFNLSMDKIKTSTNDFVFLNVASIDGRKNQNLLISAAKVLIKDYSNLKIICAGNVMDPLYHTMLLERIHDSGLGNNVIFPGYITNPVDLYKIAHAFVLPSLVEGWSVAMTEAMYFGLPLVLTDVGGASEILSDPDMGLLVGNSFGDICNLTGENLGKYVHEQTPSNLEELIESMKNIMDRYDHWEKFSRKRTQTVLDKYTVATQVKKTIDVFQKQL